MNGPLATITRFAYPARNLNRMHFQNTSGSIKNTILRFHEIGASF